MMDGDCAKGVGDEPAPDASQRLFSRCSDYRRCPAPDRRRFGAELWRSSRKPSLAATLEFNLGHCIVNHAIWATRKYVAISTRSVPADQTPARLVRRTVWKSTIRPNPLVVWQPNVSICVFVWARIWSTRVPLFPVGPLAIFAYPSDLPEVAALKSSMRSPTLVANQRR